MDLKPCPFCEGPADHDGDEDFSPCSAWCSNECNHGSAVFAIDGWNTRPIEDALTKERDEAREKLNQVCRELSERDNLHCKDCCCARSWSALGDVRHDGTSIPEHIRELVKERDEALAAEQGFIAVAAAAMGDAAEMEKERDEAREKLERLRNACGFALRSDNWRAACESMFSVADEVFGKDGW